jgi:hypothetical protein
MEHPARGRPSTGGTAVIIVMSVDSGQTVGAAAEDSHRFPQQRCAVVTASRGPKKLSSTNRSISFSDRRRLEQFG